MSGLRFPVVGRGGVEPPTFHFSGGRSYQLSYLPERPKLYSSGIAEQESVRTPRGFLDHPRWLPYFATTGHPGLGS